MQLAVLGKPQLIYNDQPLTADLISVKGQALFIYLAVTGQAHSRSALAGLLWGEMPEETARANLRLTLSKLRKAIPGDYLNTTRQNVSLNGALISLDAWDFERGLAAATQEPVGVNHQPPVSSLQTLLSLYRGDFLEDFYVPNALEFETWLLGQRERWRQMAVTGLYHLAKNASTEDGIAVLRKLLTIEPWHEEGHYQLMRLLAAAGQRSAALAQFETCRRLLDEELGIEPAAETVALYERIKAGEQGSRDAVSPAPFSACSPAQFAGGANTVNRPF